MAVQMRPAVEVAQGAPPGLSTNTSMRCRYRVRYDWDESLPLSLEIQLFILMAEWPDLAPPTEDDLLDYINHFTMSRAHLFTIAK
jgi:hypothetical protein